MDRISMPTPAGIQLGPDEAVPIEGGLLDLVRSELRPDEPDELVEYYSKSSRRFCIGKWVSRANGLVQEITSYTDMSEVDWTKLGFIQYWLSPQRHRDLHERQRFLARRMRQRKLDSNAKAVESRRRFDGQTKKRVVVAAS